MYSLKAENSRGEVLDFSTSTKCEIHRIEGLNPPPATVNRTANTTVDGSKVNSVKLESRNIVMYIKPKGNIEASRLYLYRFFASKKAVTLHFKNSSRDVYISGVVETCELCHFDNPQTMQVSIICPDPYFKDKDGLKVRFSDVTPCFEFPFSIPAEGVEFSIYTINNRKSIINTGEVDTGVIIELYATGDCVNPTLYNVTKGTFIKLNISMQKSDTIIIDTNIDKKSITLIRNGEKINAFGYMRPDSDFFTLSEGDNVFTYACEVGSDNLQITFNSSVLYSGV